MDNKKNLLYLKIDIEGEEKKLSFTPELNFINVKKKISSELFNNDLYLDMEFDIETTIRGFGKYNLEPGLFSRILDNRKINEFNIIGRELKVKLIKTDKKYDIDNINKVFIKRDKSSDIKKKEFYDDNKKLNKKEFYDDNKKLNKNKPYNFKYSNDDFPELYSK